MTAPMILSWCPGQNPPAKCDPCPPPAGIGGIWYVMGELVVEWSGDYPFVSGVAETATVAGTLTLTVVSEVSGYTTQRDTINFAGSVTWLGVLPSVVIDFPVTYFPAITLDPKTSIERLTGTVALTSGLGNGFPSVTVTPFIASFPPVHAHVQN